MELLWQTDVRLHRVQSVVNKGGQNASKKEKKHEEKRLRQNDGWRCSRNEKKGFAKGGTVKKMRGGGAAGMKKKGYAKGGAVKKMMGGGAAGMKKKGFAKGGAIKKMRRGGRA